METTGPKRVAGIIRDAGGEVVGRTRLQKIAYLLDVAGYDDGFEFRYRHFGPYSEEIAASTKTGALLGDLTEKVKTASWGGTYSIYKVDELPSADTPSGRSQLACRAAEANAIELELAATAVFLSRENCADPWVETGRRKPQKSAEGRLERAQGLLAELRKIDVKNPLPKIA